MAGLASALAESSESSVIGGGHLSLAGATLLNGYLVTAVTMCDAHRATMTHITPEVVPPALAIAERDGLSGRDLLVALAAGSEVATRIGLRPRLSRLPRPRLPRAGRARPVRRGRRRRPLAEIRCRHHGAGVRSRRQPGGRHLCRLGHADGEISSVPRRAVGLDGGFAGATELCRHPPVSHRQRRRPLQRLCQWRKARTGDRRTRAALRARTDRVAAVALGVAAPGAEHGAVRDRGKARHRSRARAQGRHRAKPADLRLPRRLRPLPGKIRGAVVGALWRRGDPARSGADLGAIRAGAVTTIRSCAASPPKKSRSAPMPASPARKPKWT